MELPPAVDRILKETKKTIHDISQKSEVSMLSALEKGVKAVCEFYENKDFRGLSSSPNGLELDLNTNDENANFIQALKSLGLDNDITAKSSIERTSRNDLIKNTLDISSRRYEPEYKTTRELLGDYKQYDSLDKVKVSTIVSDSNKILDDLKLSPSMESRDLRENFVYPNRFRLMALLSVKKIIASKLESIDDSIDESSRTNFFRDKLGGDGRSEGFEEAKVELNNLKDKLEELFPSDLLELKANIANNPEAYKDFDGKLYVDKLEGLMLPLALSLDSSSESGDQVDYKKHLLSLVLNSEMNLLGKQVSKLAKFMKINKDKLFDDQWLGSVETFKTVTNKLADKIKSNYEEYVKSTGVSNSNKAIDEIELRLEKSFGFFDENLKNLDLEIIENKLEYFNSEYQSKLEEVIDAAKSFTKPSTEKSSSENELNEIVSKVNSLKEHYDQYLKANKNLSDSSGLPKVLEKINEDFIKFEQEVKMAPFKLLQNKLKAINSLDEKLNRKNNGLDNLDSNETSLGIALKVSELGNDRDSLSDKYKQLLNQLDPNESFEELETIKTDIKSALEYDFENLYPEFRKDVSPKVRIMESTRPISLLKPDKQGNSKLLLNYSATNNTPKYLTLNLDKDRNTSLSSVSTTAKNLRKITRNHGKENVYYLEEEFKLNSGDKSTSGLLIKEEDVLNQITNSKTREYECINESFFPLITGHACYTKFKDPWNTDSYHVLYKDPIGIKRQSSDNEIVSVLLRTNTNDDLNKSNPRLIKLALLQNKWNELI